MITPRQADKLIKSGEAVTLNLLLDGQVRGVVLDRPDRWNIVVHVADKFGEFIPGRTGLFDRSEVTVVAD